MTKAPGLIATLEEAFVGGGIEVVTPADAPQMRTVIMANGALFQFIARDAADDEALQQRHARDVTARVTGGSVARLERWRRWIERAGWALSTGGWCYWLLSHEDMQRLVFACATTLVAVTLRWVMPRLIRWVLRLLIRRAFDYLIAEWSKLEDAEAAVETTGS